jgi:hypothetical protein
MPIELVSSEAVHGRPVDFGDGNSYVITDFIGGRRPPAGKPSVYLVELSTPHGIIQPHFHAEDQFQLVTSGSGRLGRAPLLPGIFHYVDAYVPYGPIEAGDAGLTFFTIRPRANTETHFMPGSGNLRRRRSKRPGFVHTVNLSQPISKTLVGPYSDGLACLRLSYLPRDKIEIKPSDTCWGQIGFVLGGQMLHNGKSYPRWSCFSVGAGESVSMAAGAEGADLLILQFGAAGRAT